MSHWFGNEEMWEKIRQMSKSVGSPRTNLTNFRFANWIVGPTPTRQSRLDFLYNWPPPHLNQSEATVDDAGSQKNKNKNKTMGQ